MPSPFFVICDGAAKAFNAVRDIYGTKAAIAEYLLDKSYDNKCENPEESTLKATLHILYHAAKTKPPNIYVQSKIRQCEDELAALKKKRKTSRYWAWVSALKEEHLVKKPASLSQE